MSTAFHPQTDGQTERMNRVLEDMLRNYVDAKHDDWDHWLPALEFAVNDSFNGSIGTTPFFLTYGAHPLRPTLRGLPGNVPGAETYVSDLDLAINKAKSSLDAAQQRQKSAADKHRRDLTLEVGQMVMLSSKNIQLKAVQGGVAQGARKLLPKWLGPNEVLSKVGRTDHEVSYKLRLPPQWKRHDVFHISVLKPYFDDGSNQPPPPVTWVDDEPAWEVERILDHDFSKGKFRYLLKWKGYGAAHNTWEPESGLVGHSCDSDIEEHLKTCGTYGTAAELKGFLASREKRAKTAKKS